jgi:hypothetical protein
LEEVSPRPILGDGSRKIWKNLFKEKVVMTLVQTLRQIIQDYCNGFLNRGEKLGSTSKITKEKWELDSSGMVCGDPGKLIKG